ncbi:hypothetical protein ACIRVK_04565 [Streptomyces sp. NPDC101152]|uniref:hypothetical protein n=1 Tax=Streptomyces sp. NPDC101152 TaxID=3366116 RepID=UPI003808333A
MTNDALRATTEETEAATAVRDVRTVRTQGRPAVAVAVVPLWARPRTGVRR